MNVVVLLTDDQEIGTIDAETMPYLHSEPHGHWVKFPNARLSTPWCGPSRANLLGGRRTDVNGVMNNDTGGFGASTAVNVAIRNAGAKTAMLGKWLNHYGDSSVPAGWDRFWALQVPGGAWEYYDDWTATSYTDPGPAVEEVHGTDYPGEYITDIIAGHAADFITANAASPFFLYVAFTAPHDAAGPPTPAPRHAAATFTAADPPDWNQPPVDGPSWLTSLTPMGPTAQTETRNTAIAARRTLLAVDEAIEMIVGALVTAGVLDDTLVVFLTDNGHARGRKQLGFQQANISKTSPYEYASNAMLRVRHAGAVARSDERLIDSLDLPATFLDIFGADPLVAPQGANMLPAVLDTATGWRTASLNLFVGTSTDPNWTIPKWRAVRTDRWRYGHYYEVGEQELYDLDADPNETVNVAAANPGVVANMEALEAALLANPLASFSSPSVSVLRWLEGGTWTAAAAPKLWDGSAWRAPT